MVCARPGVTPTPSDPLEVLEPWIAARLALPGGRTASDHDFNPGLQPEVADEAMVPAAVLVALTTHDDGVKVILTRRADSLTRHSGQIAFPGGRADPGETSVETALREAQEEVALDPRFVRVAGVGDPYRTFTGFEVTPVVGVLQPGFTLTPSAAEVAEIFEAPFAFLMDAANHQQHRHAESGRRFYAMPYLDRYIWGATAGILRALYERLFGGADAGPPHQPT